MIVIRIDITSVIQEKFSQKENHGNNKNDNNDQILPDVCKKRNVFIEGGNNFFHQAYISST